MKTIFYNYLANNFVRNYFRSIARKLSKRGIPTTSFKNLVYPVYEKSYRDHEYMIVDRPAEFNLKIVAMIYAIHVTLLDLGIDETTSLEIFKECLMRQQKRLITFTFKFLKFLRVDLFTFVRRVSYSKQINAYGKGFNHVIITDTANTLVYTVTKCFYHTYFTSVGKPQLTSVLCEYDNVWGDQINTVNCSLVFKRPVTIGKGDSHCSFEFYRREKRKSDKDSI